MLMIVLTLLPSSCATQAAIELFLHRTSIHARAYRSWNAKLGNLRKAIDAHGGRTGRRQIEEWTNRKIGATS